MINYKIGTKVYFVTEKDCDIIKPDFYKEAIKVLFKKMTLIKDAHPSNFEIESQYIKRFKIDKIDMQDGSVKVYIDFADGIYYDILSELIGVPITGEYQLIKNLRELATMKFEYEKVQNAYEQVRYKGYGIVTPSKEEITINNPEVVKHGSKYGVKIKATAPSIHMIKADIETEIAPIVGTMDQAEDLIEYDDEKSYGPSSVPLPGM